MAIVVNPSDDPDEWLRVLADELPDEELRLWPDVGVRADVDLLIAWLLPRADVASFTNLRAILSLGAGTEQWQKPGMPDVPVVRLADPTMSDEMAAYVLAWVIRHHRGFASAEASQRAARWERPEWRPTGDYRVGILGHGTIGARIGQVFLDLGYPVNAWSRTGDDELGVEHFVGPAALDDFLASSDAVVSVLPATDETRGLLGADRLARFATGSLFLNIGRGSIADEADLLAALDEGPLEAAVLDVTDPEPPPPGSPLFAHPKVTLTAHISGITQAEPAARIVAANVRRIRAGETPFPLLDRTRGY